MGFDKSKRNLRMVKMERYCRKFNHPKPLFKGGIDSEHLIPPWRRGIKGGLREPLAKR